jgi:hypothetical protein
MSRQHWTRQQWPQESQYAPCRGRLWCAIAPPIKCRRDVVEKLESIHTIAPQHEPALPIIAKIFGQHYRDVTLFEMARQQRESHQQTKQIEQNDPFVLKVSDEPHNAIASPKACERDFYRSRLSPSR